MANRRDLTIGINGDDRGLAATFEDAKEEARGLDRELAKLERQQDAQERATSRAASSTRRLAIEEEKAALAARKMGAEVKTANDRAATAAARAEAAAEAYKRGLISEAAAIRAKERADTAAEKAAVKTVEADLAAREASERLADAHEKASRAASQQSKEELQLARNIQIAAAAAHLAALRDVGDTKEYNRALTRLGDQYGNVKGTALEAFDLIESKGNTAYRSLSSAGEKFASTGPAMIVPAANAIAQLPTIASIAGSGVSLALGGALAGLGLYAQHGYADVQRSITKLKSNVTGDLREISGPFHDTWLELVADADNAFKQLEPSLAGAFGEMAPAVTKFGNVVISSLSGPRVQAAITSIGHSFSVTLDALGPAVSDSIGNIATGIQSITDAAASNPQALAGLVEGIGTLTRYAGEGIGALIKYKDQVSFLIHTIAGSGPDGLLKFVGTMKDGTEHLLGMGHGLQVAGGSFPTFQQKAIMAAAGAHQLMTAQQAATLSSTQMADAMDKLTAANTTAFDAETQYMVAVKAATAAAKASNAGIHGSSQAAVQNREALSSLSGAIRTVMETTHPTAAAIEGMRKRFIASAVNMGVTRGEASRLADQLLGVTHAANTVPSNKKITITDNAVAATSRINRVQQAINALHNKTVTLTTKHIIETIEIAHRTQQAENARANGGIDRYAGGGLRRDLDPMVVSRPTVLFGETQTGGEAYIPLGANKRGKSTDLLRQVAGEFGLDVVKRIPVQAAPAASGAGGVSGPAQVTQNNVFQAKDPHVAARESARELAWMLRG